MLIIIKKISMKKQFWNAEHDDNIGLDGVDWPR